MKIWTWLKGLSWVAIGGAILTAALMILGARRSGKLEADVAHDEAEVERLQKGSAVDLNEAAKLQRGITAKKVKAREIRKKSEARLERIGEDEAMADIAARFNGKRVRSRTDTAA
jgi:hypothetical protein